MQSDQRSGCSDLHRVIPKRATIYVKPHVVKVVKQTRWIANRYSVHPAYEGVVLSKDTVANMKIRAVTVWEQWGSPSAMMSDFDLLESDDRQLQNGKLIRLE